MRLDNRSRGLLLSGQALDGEAYKAVQEYYEGTGGVMEKVEGGVKVEYPNRDMAEKVSRLLRVSLKIKVMVAGLKSVPGVAEGLSMGWWHPPSTNGKHTAGNEVEMVEEEHRGERDEED
jgi:RNA-binding protein 26